MKVLGIESSCDETAAAVVENGYKLLSNSISSSVDLHAVYGGVVPEIASRSHLGVITPTIKEALNDANCQWSDIDAIAVTYGPGLSGSLLIGIMTARTLAIAKHKPLIPVNHVHSHVYAAMITESPLKNYSFPQSQPQFPILSLIVSGGHTQLVLMTDHKNYKVLGKTADDAVGEAFDKVAKILGLPYPGGPSISKAAQSGNPEAFTLPQSKMSSPYDFSFSGLKTAVLRAVQELCGKPYDFPSSRLAELLNESQKADIAASFQKTAVQTLASKLFKAFEEFKPRSVVVAGGVAANGYLRKTLTSIITAPLFIPDIKLCTDNAAMVASLGFYLPLDAGRPDSAYHLQPVPSLAM